MHFCKKNQHVWEKILIEGEKILIEGGLQRRSHNIPLRTRSWSGVPDWDRMVKYNKRAILSFKWLWTGPKLLPYWLKPSETWAMFIILTLPTQLNIFNRQPKWTPYLGFAILYLSQSLLAVALASLSQFLPLLSVLSIPCPCLSFIGHQVASPCLFYLSLFLLPNLLSIISIGCHSFWLHLRQTQIHMK